MSAVAALIAGLAAGCVHVLSGPDHLAALLPLATDSRSGRAWVAGARWGLGHVGGVLLVGVAALLLREAFPLAWVSTWSERLVGAMLVAIGLWAVRQAFRIQIHVHEHEHDGVQHAHIHVHGASRHVPGRTGGHAHGHAAFAVGVVHGLAGSGHFLAVLPALALPALAAGAYLTAFGVGTIVAMAVFTCSMGWMAARFARRAAAVHRVMLAGSGALAMAVGVVWIALQAA